MENQKEKYKNQTDPYRVEATFSEELDTSAATEMTGLIPRQVESGAELESYKNLYHFSPEQYVEDAGLKG